MNNGMSLAGELAKYLGEDVAEAAIELRSMKDYSEFKLAEALKMEVNDVRNLLYKLHSASLASFIKKKDHKIGWYIYYWTFQDENVTDFLLNEKKAKLDILNDKLSKEHKANFYSCNNRCVTVDFDKAFEFSFHCPECGNLLEQENHVSRIDDWKREKEMLEMNIDELKLKKKQSIGKIA